MAAEQCGSAPIVTVAEYPSATVIHVGGVLDIATAPVLRAVLFEQVEHGRPVLVNLAWTGLLDGHSIGMLSAARRRAAEHGSSVWAVGATGRVLQALELTGAVKLLTPPDPDPTQMLASETAEDRTVEGLLRARLRLPAGEPVREVLRRLAIERAYPLATALARRYRASREPIEDLTQVATLGLIKAVDGYRPQRGTVFRPYAIATVLGELKRHFRDRVRHLRIPRRLQEIGLEIPRVDETLAQRLGRSPTVGEIASYLDVSEDDVLEAMEAAQACRSGSLSAPVAPFNDNVSLADRIGGLDDGFERIDDRLSLRPLLADLPAREQRILALRFYGNLTQSQIAAEIGVSQMHVSRLLMNAINRLRCGLAAD
jgi:RNA polymerase sigma-B factor